MLFSGRESLPEADRWDENEKDWVIDDDDDVIYDTYCALLQLDAQQQAGGYLNLLKRTKPETFWAAVEAEAKARGLL